MWIDDYQVWLTESQSLQNGQLVADYFNGTDWTPESISAMLGNMRHESSINPNMYEYGYAWEDDRGYGLVQWTPRSKYWDWAVANGLTPEDGDSQLARIQYEVDNNIQWIPVSPYNMTFAEFRQNSGNWSVDYLTEAFTWSYERPNAQAGQDSMPARKAFAALARSSLNFGSGGGGSKPLWPTTPGLPITSPYGSRTHPITGEVTFHAAIDIGGEGVNHPVYATQSGTVLYKGYNEISGNFIRLRHTGDSYFSQYLHLESLPTLAIGAKVTKGQQIAVMGSTGGSTGIHLDFAIATVETGWFTEEGTIDPEVYLQMSFPDGPTGNTSNDIFKLWLSGALPW